MLFVTKLRQVPFYFQHRSTVFRKPNLPQQLFYLGYEYKMVSLPPRHNA